MYESELVESLLEKHREGDADAFDQLVSIVYPHLRRLARRQLAGRRAGLLFDTSGLVNEAFLQLAGSSAKAWTSAEHFFGVAARAMRQVLVDYARKRHTLKRGSGREPTTFDNAEHSVKIEIDTVLDVDHALERMAGIDARLVRVVECRYFAGLTEEETAKVLSVTSRTVQRDWARARAWLRSELATGG